MNVTFKLEDFEGPLDLLLYLLDKNKMSIYDIEISSITDQYMSYIDAAKDIPMEQMSEFIVMAATLLYIKSKMLPSTFTALTSIIGWHEPSQSPLSVRTNQQSRAPFAFESLPVTIAIDSLPSTVAADLLPVLVAAD